MSRSEFDLNLLVIFEAIFEEKNLTRAGEDVGLSQTAMSGALARLRPCTGDELFVCTRDGMVPTAAPRAMMEAGAPGAEAGRHLNPGAQRVRSRDR